KSGVPFDAAKEDFTARSKQRLIAFRVWNRMRPQLPVERHEPQPMSAFLAECGYDDLPTIRRYDVSFTGHSHDSKARKQGFIAPGIEVHHAQLRGIGSGQRAS